MRWNKLEYGKWPKGKILLKIISDRSYLHYEIGKIEINTFDNETYFIVRKDGIYRNISIDSIYDTEPHYIKLENKE